MSPIYVTRLWQQELRVSGIWDDILPRNFYHPSSSVVDWNRPQGNVSSHTMHKIIQILESRTHELLKVDKGSVSQTICRYLNLSCPLCIVYLIILSTFDGPQWQKEESTILISGLFWSFPSEKLNICLMSGSFVAPFFISYSWVFLPFTPSVAHENFAQVWIYTMFTWAHCWLNFFNRLMSWNMTYSRS